MSSLILFSMILCSLSTLPLMAQPLSLGLVIMISTLLMCLASAMLVSQWYGYILFLIYVGGLLVMFAYVAALSPNVLFNQKTSSFLIFILMFIIFMSLKFYWFKDSPMLSDYSLQNKNMMMKVYGIELVSSHMISILIGLAFILLINLIAVVKICYFQHNSLRPFKNKF
uniref:NADH-ubiquinone oxidoreductase chain 6 n=1 Tax=Typhlosyrinx sp. MNHN IM 2013-18371 TaxID=2259823 RepID=A0A344H222_9CAEN|nr:NADH dehydrogenase subunit 6 [Typhlosyrinx sp. MNHN IM 2013-18371]AXA45437.1 NADH dehydrogenase subunit 6 [Typhlosyrinx sp. MNHN IM 2013-18371]